MRRVWVVAFALLSLAIMSYVIEDYYASIKTISLSKPWLLLVAIVFHCIFWILATTFWRYAVRITTHQKLSMGDSFRQLALVAVGKYLPGKVWGFLARGAALKQTSATMRGAFAATFVEQWAMLMSAGLVGGALLILTRPTLWFVGLGILAIAISLLGNHLFQFGTRIFRIVLERMADSSELHNTSLLSYPQYLTLLILHTIMWMLLGSVLTSIFYAFSPQPFSLELCAALILANTVGIVVGFVALFAPAGFGVREAVTTAVLLPYLPLEQAAVLSIAFRVWTTLVDMFLSLVLLWHSARATHPIHS